MAKFYNVTIHMSLPAASKADAEAQAAALIDDSDDSVNVHFIGDTCLCDPDAADDEADDESVKDCAHPRAYSDDKTPFTFYCPDCGELFKRSGDGTQEEKT